MGRIKRRDPRGCVFTVEQPGKPLGELRVGIPGDHYVRNALASIAVGLELQLSFESIKRGIEAFGGVGRRFEIKGEVGGVTVVDDYGHHPTEITATIRAAIDNFNKRLFVIFQPHRFTRTQALADEFAASFAGADAVFITDIYAAGEEPIPGVTAEMLIEKAKSSGAARVCKAASFESLVDEIMPELGDGDLVLTLGAGDIFRCGEMIVRALDDRERVGKGGTKKGRK
jgi:UDP-N-acetylmuramate--alanine ligase